MENRDERKQSMLNIPEFFIGLLLLAAGLFMLSKRVIVSNNFFDWGWGIGSFHLSSGTVVIPLIIGVIWYFINNKSIAAKTIIVLGILFIVVAIIMSVKIHFVQTSLFDYILILLISAAGSGLMLRAVFKKNKNKED